MRISVGDDTKAASDFIREKAREAGMKFETAPEPEAPWKRDLRKLSDVLLDEPPAFAPEP